MHTNIKSAIKSEVKTGPALIFTHTHTGSKKHTCTEEIIDSSYRSRVGGLRAHTHTLKKVPSIKITAYTISNTSQTIITDRSFRKKVEKRKKDRKYSKKVDFI
jgi:hypothetical protein